LIIEPEPVDGEALWDRQLTVDRHQPPAMVGVIAAASLAGIPDGFTRGHRRAEDHGGLRFAGIALA
jgi:hypothetical protein